MYAHLFNGMKSYKTAASQRSQPVEVNATATIDGFAHLFPGDRKAARKTDELRPDSGLAGQRALDFGRTQKTDKGIPRAALRDPVARHFLTSKTLAFQFFLANRRPDILT